MYFQFRVSGKIFLYSIIIFSTFSSIVPINCHEVVPYRITNIYSLMPITVMVLLCVNTSATVCDCLCLLGCSPDWAAVVVCRDARKTFWHVPPLATFDTWLITNFCQNQLCFFFWYTVIVPQENKQNYSSLYLHHELQYNKLEDKNSAPNDSKHSPVLLCSKFLHKWNMDFIDRLLSPHCNIAFLSTPDSFCSWRSRFWFQAGDGLYVWTTE